MQLEGSHWSLPSMLRKSLPVRHAPVDPAGLAGDWSFCFTHYADCLA